MDNQNSGARRTSAAVAIFGLALAVVISGVSALVWYQVSKNNMSTARISDEPPTLTPVSVKKTVVPREGYVGSQACATCHQDLYDSYRKHPMGNSMAHVSEAPVIEDYANAEFEAPGNRQYLVERREERVFHHERMFDNDGQEIYDLAKEITYILGSGRRGRSYLISEGGHLYQSPISWYSQAQKWDLPPGYAGVNHSRFWRRLGEGCLYCHAGQTAVHSEVEDYYPQKPFYEVAIGCERCHGPGEEHIKFHNSNEPNEGQTDPIINPEDLERTPAEAVCSQCHLAGESIIPRKGRTHRDFRPGQRLEDTWMIFVAGDSEGDAALTQAVSHVEQMRASQCYQVSGQMNCVTCHDPHSTPEPENRTAFYNARCGTCHDNQSCALPEPERLAAPAAGSCIACHMPRFLTNDIPHTAGSDHRILRRATGSNTAGPKENPLLTPRIFDNADRRVPQREVKRAVGLARVEQPDFLNDPKLLESALRDMVPLEVSGAINAGEIVEAVGDDLPTLKQLGGVFQMHRDTLRANVCWQKILQYSPHDEDAHWWLMFNYRQSGDLERAAKHMEYVLGVNALDPQTQAQKALLLEAGGNLPEAIRAAEKAVAIDPALVSMRQWLVDAYRRQGMDRQRQEQVEKVRRINEVLQQQQQK